MAKEYLDKLSALIDKTTSGRFKNIRLECKHFFSGAAMYADDRICISLTPVGFAIKLPEETRNVLLRNGEAKPLRYFSKGPIKKEYVVLPEMTVRDINVLKKSVNESIEYVLS
jgi:TfoX/Sxy family transcriptional regulator of competence genes